ncbi:MAG: hypothetical protein NZ908_02055 [Candidatus Micrarchaeota archaeon]|nr:hypothetical protein [Candidatus Micrarchaeota archaeon]MCX8154321.1 hypothetical protein [Candidatus Micrarchaeota archaeon]
MGERVGKEMIKREKGYLYFVGKDGKVYKVPSRAMKNKVKSMKAEVVSKETIKREPGYIYYLGKSGYVERSPMKRRMK